MSYHDLIHAIIKQAVKDYREALKQNKKYPEKYQYKIIISDIEVFFRSDYFKSLTDVSGEWLIETLRGELK